jgi:SET domain
MITHRFLAPFFLDNTPGMGKGYRAAAPIRKGTLVFQESPVILLPANLPQGQREATIEHALQHLPIETRMQFSELQISYRFSVYAPNVGRFMTNALPCEDDMHSAGLFLLGARFNSSCTPNVHQTWNGTQMQFRAVANILPGQELFICYNIRDLLCPQSERQAKIQQSAGYECKCVACLATTTRESDQRRVRVGRALALGVETHNNYYLVRQNVSVQQGNEQNAHINDSSTQYAVHFEILRKKMCITTATHCYTMGIGFVSQPATATTPCFG